MHDSLHGVLFFVFVLQDTRYKIQLGTDIIILLQLGTRYYCLVLSIYYCACTFLYVYSYVLNLILFYSVLLCFFLFLGSHHPSMIAVICRASCKA